MSPDRPCSVSTRAGKARRPLAALSIPSALAAMLLGLSQGPAEAGLVLQVQDTVASAQGLGSFDVVLVNTGGTFQVSAFTVELSVASNSGVKSSGVTAGPTTAPYLFGTLQAPPLTSPLPRRLTSPPWTRT
jgi:hypothetical protein